MPDLNRLLSALKEWLPTTDPEVRCVLQLNSEELVILRSIFGFWEDLTQDWTGHVIKLESYKVLRNRVDELLRKGGCPLSEDK